MIDGHRSLARAFAILATSMATPHVAGAGALIFCGRLNVYNAMATALNDPSLPTPIP
jgi:hypothetical protein